MRPVETVLGLVLLAVSGLVALDGIGDLDGRFVIPGRSVTAMPYAVTLPLLACIAALAQITVATRRWPRALWLVAFSGWVACAVAFLLT